MGASEGADASARDAADECSSDGSGRRKSDPEAPSTGSSAGGSSWADDEYLSDGEDGRCPSDGGGGGPPSDETASLSSEGAGSADGGTPPAHKPSFGKPCRYGPGCSVQSCRFDHPPDRRPEGLRWVGPTFFGRPCRHGLECPAKSCRFEHPPGWKWERGQKKTKCLSAIRCSKKDCPFAHPPGWDWRKGEKKECLNRRFCVREDCPFAHPPGWDWQTFRVLPGEECTAGWRVMGNWRYCFPFLADSVFTFRRERARPWRWESAATGTIVEDRIPALSQLPSIAHEAITMEAKAVWGAKELERGPPSVPEPARGILGSAMRRHICHYCARLMNVEYAGPESAEVVGVFCAPCLSALAKTAELACGCGRPRFLSALGAPAPLCSDCHGRARGEGP